MKRRNFLQSIASIVVFPALIKTGESNIDQWKNGQFDFLWDDTRKVWTKDPFVKIYTTNGLITEYNQYFSFEQKNNTAILRWISRYKNIHHCPWYFLLDNKNFISSESKLNFIKHCKEEYKKDHYLFEIIGDNDKSTLIAFVDNDDEDIKLLNSELRGLA